MFYSKFLLPCYNIDSLTLSLQQLWEIMYGSALDNALITTPDHQRVVFHMEKDHFCTHCQATTPLLTKHMPGWCYRSNSLACPQCNLSKEICLLTPPRLDGCSNVHLQSGPIMYVFMTLSGQKECGKSQSQMIKEKGMQGGTEREEKQAGCNKLLVIVIQHWCTFEFFILISMISCLQSNNGFFLSYCLHKQNCVQVSHGGHLGNKMRVVGQSSIIMK